MYSPSNVDYLRANGRNMTDHVCPDICWFTGRSNINTVLKLLASSPAFPIFLRYSTECHKGAIKYLFCASKSSISIAGGSTGCIAVTSPWCITDKQLSVSTNNLLVFKSQAWCSLYISATKKCATIITHLLPTL